MKYWNQESVQCSMSSRHYIRQYHRHYHYGYYHHLPVFIVYKHVRAIIGADAVDWILLWGGGKFV